MISKLEARIIPVGACWRGCLLAAMGGLAPLLAAPDAFAQGQPASDLRTADVVASDSRAASADHEEVVLASARILPAEGAQPARLQVTAKIKEGWHIYSITQKPGGPVRTKIKVPESPRYKVGEFKAITPPVSHPEPDFDNLLVEEHSGQAVWEAPLTLTAGAAGLKITGAVSAQACSTACLPPTDYKFETADK